MYLPGFPRIHQGGGNHENPTNREIIQQSRKRAQGGDQAAMASIARARASKSETWSLVFCLRTYSMNGVSIRGTNEETGSQVSLDGP